MIPAVILARVSHPDQEEGHSPDAQLANSRAYAERKGMEVLQVFSITESSTKGDRPEFERMIAFIGRQKKRTALVVDCLDRLQRSFTHIPVLNALMEKDILEIHFIREGYCIDKDSNSMQKLDRLADLLLEGHIVKEVYERKYLEITSRRDDINRQLTRSDKGDNSVKLALGGIMALASKTSGMFQSSNIEEKRHVLGLVFSNLSLESATFRYSLRKPFDTFEKMSGCLEWRTGRDGTGHRWQLQIKLPDLSQRQKAHRKTA